MDAGGRGDVRQAEIQARRGAPSSRAQRRPAEPPGDARHAMLTRPLPDRIDHQFRGVVDAERLHDIRAVHGHGIGAQREHRRDLFVRFAVHDQLQDFEFARGQLERLLLARLARATPAADRAPAFPAATCFTASTSSRSMRILQQVAARAGLQAACERRKLPRAC